jgi:hypothetical protein
MFLLGEVELSYQVELKMSGKTFLVEDDETVLEAALRQGINPEKIALLLGLWKKNH